MAPVQLQTLRRPGAKAALGNLDAFIQNTALIAAHRYTR